MFQKKKKKDQDQKETLIGTNSFWDEEFLDLMLSQVKLRQYDFIGSNEEIKRKASFKKEFIMPFKENVKERKIEKMNQEKDIGHGSDDGSDTDDPLS